MECNNRLISKGGWPFFTLLVTKKLKTNGCKIKVISRAEKIPITEIMEMDFKAGCFANTKTPIPKSVVATDNKIDVLYEANCLFPNVCSFCKAEVIKML